MIVVARIAHDNRVPGERYDVSPLRGQALAAAGLVLLPEPAPLVELRIPAPRKRTRGARKA